MERVFYDPDTDTTKFVYTVINNLFPDPITSFHAKIGNLIQFTATAPRGWHLHPFGQVAPGSPWIWAVHSGDCAPNPPGTINSTSTCTPNGVDDINDFGIKTMGGSLNNMTFTLVGRVPVIFWPACVDTGATNTLHCSPTDEWMVSGPEIVSEFEGCTPGFWKTHTGLKAQSNEWPPTGYNQSDLIQNVFTACAAMVGTYPTACSGSATLLDALSFKGGSSLDGKAQILLRAAVAALLNAAHPDINYPMTPTDVINQVNAALTSGDATTIINLATTLDDLNNGECPLPLPPQP